MINKAKEVVRDFYRSDILKDSSVMERFFHPEMVLIWNSPIGLSILQYEELVNFFEEVRRSYQEIRLEVSHLLADGNHVTMRYKYYVRTNENPDEEMGIAHFMAIWEVKDGKIFRGHQISQPVMENEIGRAHV